MNYGFNKGVKWKHQLEIFQTPVSQVSSKISVTVGNEIFKQHSTHNHECNKEKTTAINAVQ